MIEINLLPGTGKKARKGARWPVASNFGAVVRRPARSRARSVARSARSCPASLGIAIVGLPVRHAGHARDARSTKSCRRRCRTRRATRRCCASARWPRRSATPSLRSLNMIRAIDDDRYIWPHVMDEVSRALPPYTWLVSLGFSGVGQATDRRSRRSPAASIRRRVSGAPSEDGRHRHRARHGPHPPRRQHGRHPGAHPLHEAARGLAVPRERDARQVRARERQRKGSHPVPARHALHAARVRPKCVACPSQSR